MKNSSSSDLIARIQSGHPEGLSDLVALIGDDLDVYARALAGQDRARYAMLMEDVLVDILKHIGALKGVESLRHFALKRAASIVRKHHQWVFTENQGRRSKESDVGALLDFAEPSQHEIGEAMARLAPEEREMMAMRHQLGLSVAEISDCTMRGAAAIEEDLINARQRFRYALIANRERYGTQGARA